MNDSSFGEPPSPGEPPAAGTHPQSGGGQDGPNMAPTTPWPAWSAGHGRPAPGEGDDGYDPERTQQIPATGVPGAGPAEPGTGPAGTGEVHERPDPREQSERTVRIPPVRDQAPPAAPAGVSTSSTAEMPSVAQAPESAGRSQDSPDGASRGGPGQSSPAQSGSAHGDSAAKRGGRNLPAAIGVGLGLGVMLVASLFVVKAVFVGVAVVAVVVGLWELTSRLSETKQLSVALPPLAVGAVAMLVASYAAGGAGLAVAAGLTVLACMAWRMAGPAERYLPDIGAAVFSLFYVPFLAGFVVLMLRADDGNWRVLLFLLLTVCADTGAYAVGYKLGRTKLAPRISPGKTREGLGGAVILAMLVGALYTQFLITGGQWWQGLIVGLVAALSATLGDLGESMLKRDLGVKDMGTLLPGHGGIMDRLDSLLATAPVVWLLLVLFVGLT